MPDPDRPSGAPLSDRDADLLSERFTAAWEDPDLDSPAAPNAPPPAEPPRADPPAAPAVPAAAPVALNPARHKATLLGIAPIVSVGQSETSSKPASIPPASSEHAAPMAPKAQAAATATPLPAVSKPSASAAALAGSPAVAAATAPSPPASSPESSSVAQGLTTPSKPYVPKDDASTPAVVISEGLAADRARAERARIAQTLPAQTRSSPLGAAVQAGVQQQPVVGSSPAAALALDDTYPPLRSRKSKLPILLGGAALTGLAAFVVLQLSSVAESEPAAPSADKAAAAPAAARPTAPTDVAPAASPSPEARELGESQPPAPPPVEAAPPSPPPKKAAGAVARPRKPAPAPKRTAPKPEPRPVAASQPASEPAPAPAPKPAKGVIVRETPF
jgi:hypothetical protein